ncbi:MAG: AraC family transcriptional regulator [Bacteroidetes bacterium]|nr:AraC family transcriptional regulator [Bacteroidota bacterium]
MSVAFFDQLFLLLINGGIVLGLFVVLLINNKGARKTRANFFLSVLLVAFIFSIVHLRYAGQVMDHFSLRSFNAGDPTFLLIAPLLSFYIDELTGRRVTFSIRSLLHFVPFAFIVGSYFSFNSMEGENSVIGFIRSHPRVPIIIFWIMMVVQFSWYQVMIQRKWQAYQQLLRQEVSNTENVNLSWVKFFMAVFLVINVFFLVALFTAIHFDYSQWLWKAAGVIFSLSVFALGYKGILQREIFYTEAKREELPTTASPKPDAQLIDQLKSFMTEKKPFLDPELTLSSLAKEVSMSRTQLSQVINDGMGENFYDFVNKYRVEEVKRLMTDPSAKNFNLLGIALEAGFKSKSTFNLIFKRFTGLTPTEYRRNISS